MNIRLDFKPGNLAYFIFSHIKGGDANSHLVDFSVTNLTQKIARMTLQKGLNMTNFTLKTMT